jgi:S1-C subfamily serine protease
LTSNDPGTLDSGSWTCPACARRVPARIRECRCGFVQDLASEPQADDPQDGGGRSWLTSVVLLSVGLAVGAALALLPNRTATAPTETARTDAPAALAPLEQPLGPSQEDSVEAPLAPAPAALAVPVPAFEAPAPRPVAATTAPLEDLVSRVVPAVAFVQAGQSRGTGFFIAPDRVITNAHVVGTHSTVQLQVGDARYEARVGTLSQGTDLAVLHVASPSRTQQTLRLGTVSQARVGEEVIAVGSALGVLSNTVTRGIVSAVRQVGQVTLIQTDAAINPGNSGGPLISRSGLVIGVNSLRVAQQTAQGVAFAVAIDHATQILSGQRPSDSQTPLGSLTQMLGGRGSYSDDQRARGEQEFTRALEGAARTADDLDSYWNRYAGMCVARLKPGGERPWFAAYDAAGITLGNNASINCESWLEEVRSTATRIKDTIDRATETARQRGVFPGTVRELRRRQRLDVPGSASF